MFFCNINPDISILDWCAQNYSQKKFFQNKISLKNFNTKTGWGLKSTQSEICIFKIEKFFIIFWSNWKIICTCRKWLKNWYQITGFAEKITIISDYKENKKTTALAA